MADRRSGGPNNAAPWSEFDAEGYWRFNYDSLLPEDAQIIRHASDFLINACEGRVVRCAVDVGAGTNLYPALLMLPWTQRIVFTEFAPANIDWLNQNLPTLPANGLGSPSGTSWRGCPGTGTSSNPGVGWPPVTRSAT
jgi:hypothetical protein